MSYRISFRGTLTGLIVGSTVTTLGIEFLTLLVEKTWPMRVTEVSAWLGFWAMRNWYQGFPIDVGIATTNSLLVLAGALQWGLLGLIWDLVGCSLGNRRYKDLAQPSQLRRANPIRR
jgi:hypothetical protein